MEPAVEWAGSGRLYSHRAGTQGLFEPRHAGFISPRRLVIAQTIAAQRGGAQVIAEPALEDAGERLWGREIGRAHV